MYKKNSDGSRGEKVGCSKDEESAKRYLEALYSNVTDAKCLDCGCGDPYDDHGDPEHHLVMTDNWGLTSSSAASKGTLRTLFSGKLHQAMTMITDQLTQRGFLSQEQNKVLTDLKGTLMRMFNESVPTDLADISLPSEVLNAVAEKQSESFRTLKEVDENGEVVYRWVGISSSSFEDRDKEIITQKAQDADTDRMWRDNDFGTLDWWHLIPEGYRERDDLISLPKEIREHGLVIGDCDFSVMHGKIRVESGTYRSKEVAEMMYHCQDDLGMSILFYHPIWEGPIYNHSRTFSRAVLPKEYASNLAAQHFIVYEGGDMATLKEKWEAFVRRVGGEAKAKEILDQLEATQATLEQSGVASKEAKVCPKCGTELVDGKCPKCEGATAKAAEVCPKCGSEMKEGKCPKCDAVSSKAAKCPKCGSEMSEGKCAKCSKEFQKEDNEEGTKKEVELLRSEIESLKTSVKELTDRFSAEATTKEQQGEETKKAAEQFVQQISDLKAKADKVEGLEKEVTSLKEKVTSIEGDQPRGYKASKAFDSLIGHVKADGTAVLTDEGKRLAALSAKETPADGVKLSGDPLVDFFAQLSGSK